MTRRNLAVGLGLASMAGTVIVLSAPAFAEDAAKPAPAAAKAAADQAKDPKKAAPAGTTATGTAKGTASGVATTGTAGTPAAPATALAAASASVPTQSFGSDLSKESIDSMALRLQREFGTTNRRLGMVPFWPRGDLKVGMFHVMPYLREGVDYVSNFYRKDGHSTNLSSPNAHDASWGWINQFGFMADGRVNSQLTISAQVDYEWIVRFDEGSHDGEYYPGTSKLIDDDKKDGNNFTGNLGATWTRDPFYVRGGVAYERRDDPLDTDIDSEFDRRERSYFLTWGLSRDIIFGTKLQFEMGTNVSDQVGHQDQLDDHDRTETEYYFKASYPFLRETTRIFGRARYRQDERESEKINDGNIWGFDAGIEGSIPIAESEGRGLRGRVSLGFDSALYEDDYYEMDGTTFRNDENRQNTSLNVQVILEYLQSPKTVWSLTYLRENRFTYHGNYQISDRVELAFNHQLRPDLRGRLATYFEYDDYSGNLRQDDNTDPYDDLPGPPGDPGHTYNTSDKSGDYPSATRFGAGFGLRYAINESMDADMDFFWDRRNNSVDGYTQHHATAGITFYLNALKPKAKGLQP